MPKEEGILMEGMVTKALANTQFFVKLDVGHEVIGRASPAECERTSSALLPGDRESKVEVRLTIRNAVGSHSVSGSRIPGGIIPAEEPGLHFVQLYTDGACPEIQAPGAGLSSCSIPAQGKNS